MLEGFKLLFKIYTLTALVYLLIKMFLLSMRKETQKEGVLGLVTFLPMLLYVSNI